MAAWAVELRANKVTATLPIKVPLPSLPSGNAPFWLSASFDAVLVAEAFTCPRASSDTTTQACWAAFQTILYILFIKILHCGLCCGLAPVEEISCYGFSLGGEPIRSELVSSLICIGVRFNIGFRPRATYFFFASPKKK
ncbi:Uncharacterised protein [Stutzerimonas stutzeri]|nr:Uncharacterised protein [Stutzerimonas stutzeri]